MNYSPEQLRTIIQYATGKGCHNISCTDCNVADTPLCQLYSKDTTAKLTVRVKQACQAYMRNYPECFPPELITEELL